MTDSKKNLAKATGIIMVAMFLSRILGYVRDVVIYTKFGQNYYTDAYNAAFSIPDFLYYLLVGGALSSAFIPVISSYIAKEKKEEAWVIISTILNLVMVLMVIGISFGLAYTEELINLLVPGFTDESFDLTVQLTRIMFIQSFFMALCGIVQGVLHSNKHFLSSAIGSVLYNVGIIVFGIILSFEYGIKGFSIGVVAGSILNFAIQVPALVKTGIKYKFVFDLKHPGVVKIFKLILPVFLGLSVTHLNLFIGQNLASKLPDGGMISALRAAQRITQLPIGIFGVAVAMAFFPTLTTHLAKGEKQEFIKTLSLGFRTIIFITLPAAMGLVALNTPVVRAMFQQGNFSVENTEATSIALLFYSIGIIGYSAQQLLNRGFYANQDTKTPVFIGIATIVLNIILNYVLIKPLMHGGLALAYSIAGIANMLLLLFFFKRNFGKIDGKNIFKSFLKTLVASSVMGIFVYWGISYYESIFDLTTKLNQILEVFVGVMIGAIIYFSMTMLMKMEEADIALNLLKRKLRR